jgi:DNA-binding transcriptional LysR family regulator
LLRSKNRSVKDCLYVLSRGFAPRTRRKGCFPTRAMLETMGAAQRALSGQEKEPLGSVRLTANATVGSEVLPAILVDFRKQYPRITIELVLTNRHQDILAGEADIAIRMARPTQEALIAKRICKVGFGFYAHRDFVARCGEPKNFKDLQHYSIIGFDRDDAGARTLGIGLSRDTFALRTDDYHAQLDMMRAGFGIGVCQVAVASRQSNFVRLLPSSTNYHLEMWLAMHEDLKSSLRVRVLYEHLAKALKSYYATPALKSSLQPTRRETG